MKVMMTQHVDGVRHQVFNDSTNAVKKSLEKLVKDIEDFLLGKADEVFISVKRDYESVVLGRHAATQQLPREQRQIRSEVNSIIESTELIFKKVVGLEPETPQPSAEDPEEKGASPWAEEIEKDASTEGFEMSEGTNDGEGTGIAMADKTENEDSAEVKQPAPATTQQDNHESRAASEESTTPTTPSHLQDVQSTENPEQSAGPPLCDEPVSLGIEGTEPLTQASSRMNIPAAVNGKRNTHDESGKENEVLEVTSTLANDTGQAACEEATESSPRHERPSSAASWVQSWFSPRE